MFGAISIDFDMARDAYFFASGALSSLLGSVIAYTHFVEKRTKKKFAAETEFNQLSLHYESLQRQQIETNNILRALEGDIRKMQGAIQFLLAQKDGSQDD